VVAEVIDPARLVVTASVPAREAIALKAGQRAELVGGGQSERAAAGQVYFIGPQVDA